MKDGISTSEDMFGNKHHYTMKDGLCVGHTVEWRCAHGAFAVADGSPAVCASEDEILLWVQQRKKSYGRAAKIDGEKGFFDAAAQYHHCALTMQEVETFILSRRQTESTTVRQPQENGADQPRPTSGESPQ